MLFQNKDVKMRYLCGGKMFWRFLFLGDCKEFFENLLFCVLGQSNLDYCVHMLPLKETRDLSKIRPCYFDFFWQIF